MPVFRDTTQQRLRRARGLVDRFLRRSPTWVERPPALSTRLVDPHTRTYWSRGATAPATLIEAAAPAHPAGGERMRALLSAHERGLRSESQRPRANPAFTEALFVELMRAHQYQRAFAMLAEDCRRAWGSLEAFAAAQGAGPMHRLRGVRVLDVRHLDEWTDSVRGKTYRDVAELDVEYTIGTALASASVPRVVHLVPAGGRWWSLCYPG
jgi:hypothetical protein